MVAVITIGPLALTLFLSSISFIHAKTNDSKQGNNVQGNGIDTCQVMPKFFISFSGREVISEGECFWDFMSCSKRTQGNDKGCCKGRFEICCHQFRPTHNEHKPIPDSEHDDSLLSGSSNMEESVVPPEELIDVPTTTIAPTTESTITTTSAEMVISSKPDINMTTPVDMTSETTPEKEDPKESNDQILSNSNMDTTTVKTILTTQMDSIESSTNVQIETTTKKESWYIPKSSTQSPPTIVDCVWKFNGCIQRKFRAMESEDVCYAIFEECKMISMGMRAPVTTDELPKPISSKPNGPSVSTEANKPLMSTTNRVPETDMNDNTELISTPSEPSETVSTTPEDGLVSTESSQGSSETTTLKNDEETTDPTYLETSSTSNTEDISTTTFTNISNNNGSQLGNENTTPISITDSNALVMKDNLSTSTLSNTDSTTLVSTDELSTTTVSNIDSTALPSNEENSTTPVSSTDSTTIMNSGEPTESTKPTTLTSENEPTTTPDPTLSVTDIYMETTTLIDSTHKENIEQGDTTTNSIQKPEESTKLEEESTTENNPTTQDTTPNLIELVTGATDISSSTISEDINDLNNIPFTTGEGDSPKVYTNIFECIWAFNGCVKRGKSEDECRNSFRDCDDQSI